MSYSINVSLGYPILWTERTVLKLSLLCICRWDFLWDKDWSW